MDHILRSSQIVLCLYFLAGIVSAWRCQTGSYYDNDHDICMKCSVCPLDQITRRPCGPTADTVCGPFYEFRQFRLENSPRVTGDKAQPSAGQRPVNSPDSPTLSVTVASSEVEIAEEAEKWKELAFALLGIIGGVAVLVLAAFIYLLAAHFKNRNYKSGMLVDHEGGPTIYTRARLFSRDRLSTTDYRDNLFHLEQQLEQNKLRNHIVRNLYWKNPQAASQRCELADEVFDGSLLPLRATGPLSVIHERESESDGTRTEDSPAVFSPTEDVHVQLQPDSRPHSQDRHIIRS